MANPAVARSIVHARRRPRLRRRNTCKLDSGARAYATGKRKMPWRACGSGGRRQDRDQYPHDRSLFRAAGAAHADPAAARRDQPQWAVRHHLHRVRAAIVGPGRRGASRHLEGAAGLRADPRGALKKGRSHRDSRVVSAKVVRPGHRRASSSRSASSDGAVAACGDLRIICETGPSCLLHDSRAAATVIAWRRSRRDRAGRGRDLNHHASSPARRLRPHGQGTGIRRCRTVGLRIHQPDGAATPVQCAAGVSIARIRHGHLHQQALWHQRTGGSEAAGSGCAHTQIAAIWARGHLQHQFRRRCRHHSMGPGLGRRNRDPRQPHARRCCARSRSSKTRAARRSRRCWRVARSTR